MCQIEIPGDVDCGGRDGCKLFLLERCARARSARPLPDLLVVNRYEYEVVGANPGLVALTLGAEGAVLLDGGKEVARARAPRVNAVDGTAAGDAFCAALVVGLLQQRERTDALTWACAAGAVAASRPGAQPSLPTAAEVDALVA